MWNTEIEKQVVEIYHWSYGWYRIYSKAAVDCEANKNKMFYTTLIPNIVVSLFSGVVVIYYQENEIPNWVNIVNLIFNIIITMLVLIKNKVDQANDKSAYDLLTQRNYSLFSNIRRQLAMPVNQRQQGEEYLIWITKEYDQLNNTNILDESYFTWYQKIADDKNLPMPGMIDNFNIERSSNSNVSDRIVKIIDDWQVKPTKSKSMNIISKVDMTPPPPRLTRSSDGLVASREPEDKVQRKPTVDDLFPITDTYIKDTHIKDTKVRDISKDKVDVVKKEKEKVEEKEKTDDGYDEGSFKNDSTNDNIRSSEILDKQEVTSDSNKSNTKRLTPNRHTFKNLLSGEDMFDDNKMKFEMSRYFT